MEATPTLHVTESLCIGNRDGQHVQITATGITLHDHNGTARLQLGIDIDGQPAVVLRDAHHTARVRLSVDRDGYCSIALLDLSGVERLSGHLLDDGIPSLTFRDEKEQLRFSVVTDGEGTSLTSFSGAGAQLWQTRLAGEK